LVMRLHHELSRKAFAFISATYIVHHFQMFLPV